MRIIFTFHSIDDSGSVLSYPPSLLRRLITELHAMAVPVMDLDTLLSPETATGASLTFDDGYKSVLAGALPITKELGVSGHLFLTTGSVHRQEDSTGVGTNNGLPILDWDDISVLHREGWSVDCHTRSHRDMRELSADQVREECSAADAQIFDRLGVKPRYFAYPYGWHNADAREYVRSNYRGGLTTELRYLGPDEDSAALPRIDSYYLRSFRALRSLDRRWFRGYLSVRSVMRFLKGSQLAADCD